MGLDMYLKKKTYIGAEYQHRNVKGKIEITVGDKPVNITFNKVSYIEETAGYWRKANAIHKWFVDNCQEEDDCKQHEVSIEQLKELLNLCKRVKADHSLADELLPSEGGFFFGETDYGEWYYQNIDDTIKIIEDVIVEEIIDNVLVQVGTDAEFYYQSSW
jgi:hypothetical protein